MRTPCERAAARQRGSSSKQTPNRESLPAEHTAWEQKSGRRRRTRRLGSAARAMVSSSLAESIETTASGKDRSCEAVSGDLYGPATKIRDGGKPASTAIASSPAEATSAPSPHPAS